MLEALQKDTDVLFFNVFGICEVEKNQLRVSSYFIRSGRPHGRILTEELDKSLKNFTTNFTIPFGAWIENNEVHVAFPNLAAYDDETFKSNFALIEKTIKKTVTTLSKSIQ